MYYRLPSTPRQTSLPKQRDYASAQSTETVTDPDTVHNKSSTSTSIPESSTVKMASAIISPVPGNRTSAWYSSLPGHSRQTSAMSTHFEGENVSINGLSSRRESGMIRKLHSTNAYINSAVQSLESNSVATPFMTSAASIGQWIATERMSNLPPEGSYNDKVLSWAQLFVDRLDRFDEAIRDDSTAVTSLAYGYVELLLQLGKENEDNAKALMTSFGFFYSLSASLVNLLERTELFDVSTDIRHLLVLALVALVDLVDRVTQKFHWQIRDGTEAVTIELYETFHRQISSFRGHCDSIAEAMWNHQLSRESSVSVSGSDIKNIRSWLSPEDRVLSRLAENTSHFAHEREEMTCRWIGPYLSEFLKSPQTTLSLFGKPGSGKTILASVVVDCVSDQANNYTTLFVPINARIPAETTPTAIAKTILFQLFEKRIGNVRLLDILNRAYKDSCAITDVAKYEDVLWNAVEAALAAALPGAKELVVVVDGLDEASCPEQVLFNRLTAATRNAVNVRLITLGAEKHADSEKLMSVPVTENRIFEDISMVVRKIFTNPKTNWSKIFNTISELEQEIIIDLITEASQGSFLWAKMCTKQACHETTPDAMKNVVETLAKEKPSVTDFVTRALSAPGVSEETKYMLLWLATAERPLVLGELSALASVQVDRQTVTEHNAINPLTVLSPVSSIVFLDNGQFYLRHGLIRTAILDIIDKGKLVPVKDRHQDFVTRLLVYIKGTVTEGHEPSLDPLHNYESDQLISKNPLLDFAVRYWPFHLRQTTVYTTGGDAAAAKEFTKLFPATVTILLLQAALWQNMSTPKRVAFQTTVTNLIRQIFTAKSPVTLQSVLSLALLHHDIGQGPEATALVYELTNFPKELLDVKSLVTMHVAILFLELTSKQENVTSKTDITVKREEIYKLLIACYESHYGGSSELVIKTYRALIEHYRYTREETKIKDIESKIQKITGQYDQDGAHDELTVVVRPGEQQTDTDGPGFILDIGEDKIKTEATEAFDFQALLESAQQHIAKGYITEAERIFVKVWQHASNQCFTQYSEYWEQIKLQVTIVYSQFLQSQKRETESSCILSSIWEEYRYSSLFVSDSTASHFQQIAKIMVTVGLSAAALNIFKQVLEHYKSTGHSQSIISEVEQQIYSAHQSLVHQASSSSSSTVSEATLIEIIYEYYRSGAKVEASTFDALFGKVEQYTTEHRWKDSTRMIKKILRKLWPSLFSPSINDVTLPKEYTDRCVKLAGLLGKCYHYRRRIPREEGIRVRVYRALRDAKPVDDQTRKNVTGALVTFYQLSSQPDRVISIMQEKLTDYENHYGPENPVVIELLRELAKLTHPRPVFVDYYIRIVTVLNKDQSQCHPNAIDDLIIVVDELWRQSRYSDVRLWYDLLLATFRTEPKRSPRLQDPAFVHQSFMRYTECLRKTQADYDLIVAVTEQYRNKVKEFFGATVSITIKATLTLAMVYQEAKVNKKLALGLYEELLNIQSSEIDHTDINATIHGIREEEEAAALHSSSASSEEIKATMKVLSTSFEKFVETHSWASHETLSKLEEMISFHARHKEDSMTLHHELQKSTFQILSTKLSSTQLVSAATVIANGYIATSQISRANALTEEIYRQIVIKDASNSNTHKLDSSQGRQSLIFLAQLEHSLHKRTSTIHEILASLTAEYFYFEEFRKLTSSKSATFFSVCQSASDLHTFLIHNKRPEVANRVKEDYIAFFLATEGKRIQLTDTAEVRILLSTLLEYFSERQPSDQFLRSVGIASYYGVQGLLHKKEYDSASNLALAAFRYISAGSDFRTQGIVKYVLNLGLLITGRTSAAELDQAAAQKQLVRVSGEIIQKAIRVIRDLNIDISRISLDDLNVLIGVLGEQKQYDSLLWVLSSLWESRNKQVIWPAGVTLQLARRYILARYLTGDGLKASRMAEDILYNCRRVNGPSHSSTLEMSILLSQLYTGVAQQFQRSEGGQHMAQRLYKKVAGVHEHLLRVFLDPGLVDLDGSLESSLDGSNYDLDLGDSPIGVPYSEGEHIRQHLQLMKLAIQRLGDWPQEYSKYVDLDGKLFSTFGNDLEGVDRVDTWNLKSFGSGKASGDDDILKLESTGSWELTIPAPQGIEEGL